MNTDAPSRSTAVRLAVARLDIMRLARRSGTLLVAFDLLVNLLVGILPVVFVIAAAVMVGRVPAAVQGGLHSGAWAALLSAFVVAAAAFIGQEVVVPVRESVGELLARRIDGQVTDVLMAAATGTEGIGPLEDPLVVGDLRTAARELEDWAHSPGQACAGQLALVGRYTQLAGYAAVFGSVFSWLAAAGLVTTVLIFRYGLRGGLRKYAELRISLAQLELKNDYLKGLAIDVNAAKEIRIFGLIGWLRAYWRGCYLEWLQPLQKARRKIYLWPFVWFTAWGWAVSASVLALVGHGAAAPESQLTLTRFIMAMTAALGVLNLGEFYRESDLPTAVGMQSYNSALRFIRRVAAAEPKRPSADHQADSNLAGRQVTSQPRSRNLAAEVPTPVRDIHFDRVGFRYPGTSRIVFDGLDLTIPAGKCTALVGVNGAGKTTLVKLLARLYEPTSGAVRADGVDIRNYPIDAWRARLAVIFQDFARYEISAADNIALGAVGHLNDRAGVRSVIDAVGLADTFDALPYGADTVLASHVADGVDLSGGQWQRVALARALFALRHGSPVLVLDEPTASLDVRAEARFFAMFSSLTSGATTLLISHRFSTVRQADLIIVLEDGRVAEQGSHEELLALGGRYARLFTLQANRFTDRRVDAGDTTEVPL